MRKYLLIGFCVGLTGCATIPLEQRQQMTMNIIEGGSCASGQYILAIDKADSKQGWKSQREFLCKEGALAKENPSLDGKTYTKQQLVKKAETDQSVLNLFMP
jgi:hypothetical protein